MCTDRVSYNRAETSKRFTCLRSSRPRVQLRRKATRLTTYFARYEASLHFVVELPVSGLPAQCVQLFGVSAGEHLHLKVVCTFRTCDVYCRLLVQPAPDDLCLRIAVLDRLVHSRREHPRKVQADLDRDAFLAALGFPHFKRSLIYRVSGNLNIRATALVSSSILTETPTRWMTGE